MDINKELLLDEFQSISFDFSANVIAAEFVDNGLRKEHIFFNNLSIFKRFTSKDVESLLWKEDENEPACLVFNVNREGLYDMLPEGLVHSQPAQTPGKEVNEFNFHRAQERYARQFFSVFENEFHFLSLQLEIIEREIVANKNYKRNRKFFEHFFGNSSFLNDSQILTLIYILPLASKIRGNARIISETIFKVLNYKVSVEKKSRKKKLELNDSYTAHLDNCVLSIDTVLSDQCEVNEIYYELSIFDITDEDYVYFIRNGKYYNLIHFMLPYFFPVNTEIVITLKSFEDCKYLKTSTTESLCFLGFNSYI